MKRTWKVDRQLQAHPEGGQRWDRAYQYVLQWAIDATATPSTESLISVPSAKEADDACGSLCTGFHPTPSSKPEH